MALILRDRVKETTTTTGTGTITLAGAVAGFQSFSVIGNANTTYYAIVGGTEFEVGIGTYTSSGTTLSRDTVLTSSNSGNKVDFSAGEKDVFCTQPADKTVVKDSDSAGVTLTGTLTTGSSVILNGAQQGGYPQLSLQSGSSSTSFINFGTSADADEGQISYFPASDYMQFKAGTAFSFQANTTGIKLLDSDKVQIGDSSDLQLYHNGSYSYIDNNTSHLYIRNNVDNDDGGNIYIQAKSGENSIICYDDSTVAIYYDNSLRYQAGSANYFYANLSASSYTLYINDIFFGGNLDGGDNDRIKLGTGDDLQIYHDGSNSWIDNASSATPLRIDGYGMAITGSAGTVPFLEHTTSGMPTGHYGWVMHYTPYGNSSEVFRTVSNGVKITSNVELTGSVIFEGATDDANETTLTVADPTADRTITLPDATGTVILNTNLNFPFFKSDGSSDTIALTADSKLPFTKSDGSASNISLTT